MEFLCGCRKYRSNSLVSRVQCTLFLASVLLVGCGRQQPTAQQFGSFPSHLRPLPAPLSGRTVRGTTYVPIYFRMPIGDEKRTVKLAVVVTVRNVSARLPLVLRTVRRFSAGGNQLRDYVDRPSLLGPRATAEFGIHGQDREDSPAASIEIEWEGIEGIDEPLVEAVMAGQIGTAGFSFISSGRTMRNQEQ